MLPGQEVAGAKVPQEDIERGRVAAGNDNHADNDTDDTNNSTNNGSNHRLLGYVDVDRDVKAAQQLLLNVGPGRCALRPGLGLAAALRRAAQLGAHDAACDSPGTHYLLGGGAGGVAHATHVNWHLDSDLDPNLNRNPNTN